MWRYILLWWVIQSNGELCYCFFPWQTLSKCITMFAILCQPALVVIDYGHFQYNCVSLGFTLWGIVAVMANWDVLGTVVFCLALNYKQMELYHAMPFFFFLVGKAFKSNHSKLKLFQVLAKLALTVIATFVICWVPFALSGSQGIHSVITRIFPFSRGLYEDKVASLWCSLSIFIKIRNILPTKWLVCLTVLATLAASLPSAIKLLANSTSYQFLLSLVSFMGSQNNGL